MLYNKRDGVFTVTLAEWVRAALPAPALHTDTPAPLPYPRGKEQTLYTEFSVESAPMELRFSVAAQVGDVQEGGRLCFRFPCPDAPERASAALLRYARGYAFAAGYIYATLRDNTAPALCISLYNEEYREEKRIEETPSFGDLRRFYDRLRRAMEQGASPFADRLHRLPGMARLRFPYSHARAGQEELFLEVYRQIRRGGRLYACAPTGTGKTVSTLFPALRALGEGHCDKIFYLTPKATTANAAADTLRLFFSRGARAVTVILAAKERLCSSGVICREDRGRCPRATASPAQLEKAALSLLSDALQKHKGVLSPLTVRQVAEGFGVCPHELSLRLAEYADVVICDYNYLFDCRILLKRFFAPGAGRDCGERYCFLIDEAHNLGERAREMYSDGLSLADIEEFICRLDGTADKKEQALCTGCRELGDYFRSAIARLTADNIQLDENGQQVGFVMEKALPAHLSAYIGQCVGLCREAAWGHPHSTEVRDWMHRLEGLLDILARYDRRFCVFVEKKGRDVLLRVCCLDPAGVIAAGLERGDCAVLFSATLQPMSYYKRLLGGDTDSAELILPSPFEREGLCLAVMDKMSVRFNQRDETLSELARVILTTVGVQAGNYMVFCPSFAYMGKLEAAVRRLGSSIRSLELLSQKRYMSAEERRAFIDAFREDRRGYLIGFCVTGGIFSEGIDLSGERLIGAVVVGVGLPNPSAEREAMAEYYAEKYDEGREFAYIYPGINRVFQAAGRVIRSENDRGVVVLIDDRFAAPLYRSLLPDHWHSLKYVGNRPSLRALLRDFWGK